VRKFLGVTGLLALLAIPLGSAGATIKPPPTVPTVPQTVCAWVNADAKLKADANIGLQAKLLGKTTPVNHEARAGVEGDVYVKICVTVEKVALKVGLDGLVKVATTDKCDKGKGINLTAIAGLATTGEASGTVAISVEVGVAAGDPKDPKETVVIGPLGDSMTVLVTDELDNAVLADLGLCIGADGSVDTSVK